MMVTIPVDDLPGLQEFAEKAFSFDPWWVGTAVPWWAFDDTGKGRCVLPLHIDAGYWLGVAYLADRLPTYSEWGVARELWRFAEFGDLAILLDSGLTLEAAQAVRVGNAKAALRACLLKGK